MPKNEADVLSEQGTEVLQAALETGDDGSFRSAIHLLEQAVAVSSEGPHRAGILSTLGVAFRERFALTGDATDLERAVAVGEQAVAETTASDMERAGALSNLAAALEVRCESVGNAADLDRAVEILEQAVAATAPEHQDRAMFLTNLGLALRMRCERGWSEADFDRMVHVWKEAVDILPAGRADRNALLFEFANALGVGGGLLLHEAWTAHDLAALGRAVELLEEAVEVAPPDHPSRARFLFDLGRSLSVRYEWSENRSDLDRAIQSWERAVSASPADRAEQIGILASLCLVSWTRFQLTKSGDDLERVIRFGEEAVAAMPGDHPHRSTVQSVLQDAYRARSERDESPPEDGGTSLGAVGLMLADQAVNTGNDAALQRSIELLERAVASPGDPDRARYLAGLGLALCSGFERTGRNSDLVRAIEVGKEALAAMPHDAPDRAPTAFGLGEALWHRFEQTGANADQDAAIAAFVEAVNAAVPDHPGRALFLNRLSASLCRRYGRTGDARDLDLAISAIEEAVTRTPLDAPDRAMYLSNLGNALRIRFGRAGSQADLERAIGVGREAVAATPSGDPELAGRLSNLANSLATRFDWTGSLPDLDRAIDLHRDAVAATGTDHPDRALCLNNLASALSSRFQRTGDSADLDRAITVAEKAVEATAADDPKRAIVVYCLGVALQTRFDLSRRKGDLDRSIFALEEAVELTPGTDPERGMYQSAHCVALRARFEQTGESEDLNRAVRAGEASVEATPGDHRARAKRLVNLAAALRTRFDHAGDRGDYERGRELLSTAAREASAAPHVRAGAARSWGRFALAASNWDEALRAFREAVELRALVAPRWLGRTDQERRLKDLAGLGPEAAAAALQAGRLDAAVELLEQGRGVLFSQVLDAHSDLTDLEAARPELAAEFERLRDALDRLDQGEGPESPRAGSSGTGLDPVVAEERRRSVANELGQVITRIRGVAGFESFLLPPPLAQLLPAASDGPIVMIVVAELRSDALVLTSTGVDLVPLPGIDPASVIELVESFLTALAVALDPNPHLDRGERGRAEGVLRAVLARVWDHVTGPILDHLGFAGRVTDGEAWPRIWWCPTGLLSLLPLHASGHHDTRPGGVPDAVIDRVVSSTTPTLRALLRGRRPATVGTERRVLIVAMPHTPAASDLPGTAVEAEMLMGLLPDGVDVLGLPDTPTATFATVTAALPSHAWAHFACHGESDLYDPSSSRILLEDHRTRPLTVLDLTRARLEQVELAFLSACTTARTGLSLPDEPIHLAASCQLAGYRHVIATLWPINDKDAVRLTRDVYEALTTRSVGPTADTAAAALHAAIRRLRSSCPDQPSRWAPHVHAGP